MQRIQQGRRLGREMARVKGENGQYLDVHRSIVLESGRRLPVLGRFVQMVGDAPEQLGPSFERNDLARRRLGQPLEADVRSQCHRDTAGAQEETNLLRSSILPQSKQAVSIKINEPSGKVVKAAAHQVQRYANSYTSC